MTEVTKSAAVQYTTVQCPLGRMLVAHTHRGICAVAFGDDDEILLRGLGGRFPPARLIDAGPGLRNEVAAVLSQLTELPSAPGQLPLDLSGTAFQRRAWDAMRTIPRGTTLTYQQLAARLDCPGGQVAVGAACAANPGAVLVPCHRVLGAGNRLHGYRWGLARKQRLLEIEGALPYLPVQSNLFASGSPSQLKWAP